MLTVKALRNTYLKSKKEVIYIHDPYGIRFGSSDIYEIGAQADFDPYSFELLKHVWTDLGDEAGWSRICTSVSNRNTELPNNL